MANENKFTEKFETDEYADIIKLIKQIPQEELSNNYNDNFEKRLGPVRENVLSRKVSIKTKMLNAIEELLFTPSRRVMFSGAAAVLVILIALVSYLSLSKNPAQLQEKQIAQIQTKADTVPPVQVQAGKSADKDSKSAQPRAGNKYMASLTEKINANMNYGFMNALTLQQVDKIIHSKEFMESIFANNKVSPTIADSVKLIIKLAKSK